MTQSKLQKSEIHLTVFEPGIIVVEPMRSRMTIQMQVQVRGLKLLNLSPEEAYTLDSCLVMHAEECGYDEDTGETNLV